MTLRDNKTDFKKLTMEFKNEETFLFYDELFSYCKLLDSSQQELLLRTARELASKVDTNKKVLK